MILLENLFGLFSDAKKTTPTLDSLCKMVNTGYKAIEVGAGITSQAMANISKQFASFSGLVGALNIVDRAYEWVSQSKRKDWTWQKYTSQSALTVSQTLEFTNFLHQVGVINLGSFASQMAPGIVPLDVIKNAFYIPSSIFGIWHSTIVMRKQDEKIANFEGKRHKWQTRMQKGASDSIVEVGRKNIPSKLHFVRTQIGEIKKEKKNLLNNRAEANLGKEEKDRYRKLENRERRWQNYKEEIKAEGTSPSLLQDSSFKIHYYNRSITQETNNSGKIKTREWLAIANNIGKFVLGIIGLIAIFMGFAMTTIFVASFASGWFVTHTLNFAKGIYEERNKVISLEHQRLIPAPV